MMPKTENIKGKTTLNVWKVTAKNEKKGRKYCDLANKRKSAVRKTGQGFRIVHL